MFRRLLQALKGTTSVGLSGDNVGPRDRPAADESAQAPAQAKSARDVAIEAATSAVATACNLLRAAGNSVVGAAEAAKTNAALGRDAVVASALESILRVLNAPISLLSATAQRIAERWIRIAEDVLALIFFFGSAVSAYFIGLFVSVGLEFFSVIDKQSMIASIFLLTCLFTGIRVLVNVVTATLGTKLEQSDSAGSSDRGRPRKTSMLNVTGWAIAIAVFILVMLGPVLGPWFLAVTGPIAALLWRLPFTKVRLAFALLAILAFGALRGEQLRLQEPSLRVHGTDRDPQEVTLIMSADRGFLVFVKGASTPSFIPWDQIRTVDEVPRAGPTLRQQAVATVGHYWALLSQQAAKGR